MYMYEFYPYFTNDGSVGLFSPSDDDIYHSTYGAASEAYEKFIFPAELDRYFYNNNEIKILDICFGIGYNSKSFLNYFLNFKKKFLVNKKTLSEYNEKIYTDNVNIQNYNDSTDTNNKINQKNILYSAKIYSDNNSNKIAIQPATWFNNFKIYIKAIDTDKTLAYLSPFINSKSAPPKNYKLPFKNESIQKLLLKRTGNDNKIQKSLIMYPDELNIIILNKIIESNPDILSNSDIETLLSNKKFRKYFNASICSLFNFYKIQGGNYTRKWQLNAFLHNIYYKYISKRHKKVFNSLLYKNFNFELKIKDARAELKDDTNSYNLIFLDAFTPAKCPCLWTLDFFKLLYNHLEANGMIFTYSNSAAVRNAFLNAGFSVGKIYNESAGKFMGTLATKNCDLIKYPLSEYDLGLIKTRAGIFYRDENLTALNEAILDRHKTEVENSSLISSSKYIKQNKTKGNK